MLVNSTDPLVRPAGKLPPGLFGLPPASTTSPSESAPTLSSDFGHSDNAREYSQSHEQLDQAQRSADSTTGHPGSHGGHPPTPRTTEAATAAETAMATTAQSSTGATNPEANGSRHPPSDLPQRTDFPSCLARSDGSLNALLQRVQRLEGSSSTMTRTDESIGSIPSSVSTRSETTWEDSVVRHAHLRSQAQLQEWQVVLNKPRDFGKNRRAGEAPYFAAVISCYSAIVGKGPKDFPDDEPEIASLVAQAGESMLQCKNIARRLKTGRPSRGLAQFPSDPSLSLNHVLSSRERADAMTKLYFQSFESTHRILHVPTFWVDYQRYWDQPETVTNDLRLKVLLVIAIGSSLYDHGDSTATLEHMETIRPWIYAAEAWLAGPLEKDRLDIGGLQIYCLTILARQILSIGGDLVWMSMGSLIHRAMQTGLHRDPKYLPPVSVLQSEIRRRLWATILDLVVQASLDAWMPPRISFDDFDTEPPSNINDDDMNESTVEIMPAPRATFTTTSTQLALLESFPVRLRIVQVLNGLHSDPSYSDVLTISSKLTEALRRSSNSSMTRLDDQDGAMHSMTPFHRSLLDYLVRRFMIPLHYYFSNQAHSNPLFHYSLKVSLDASLALVSPEPDPSGSFARLMATGGGLFREGIRCAITAISLELLAHVSAQQQNGTLHRAPQHRQLIKGAVRDLIALSEERIRIGETNVKSYMFLNMIQAQVEAVETGIDIRLAIARSAADSLRFSQEILSERAQTFFSVEDSAFIDDFNEVDEASPNIIGLENYKMDWDWESYLPNTSFL